MATAFKPDLLLIDEVLGVGDASFRKKSEERVKQLMNDSGTVVIVSHSMGLLSSICTRIMLLDNGEFVTIGEPKEVLSRYKELLDLE